MNATKFLVAISAEHPAGKVEAADFVTIRAVDRDDAAIKGLRRLVARGLKLIPNTTMYAVVSPKKGPRHPTGMPICVYLMTLALGERRVQ